MTTQKADTHTCGLELQPIAIEPLPLDALLYDVTPSASALAQGVQRWFPLFARAVRAARFYPESNPMRLQQIDAAYVWLVELLKVEPEFVLHVKDSAVYADGERISGDTEHQSVGATLFQASIFQIGFRQGITRSELELLVGTIATDFGNAAHRGEDLATALWRLDLSHVLIKDFDVLSLATLGTESSAVLLDRMDDETERLKRDLERLIRSLSEGTRSHEGAAVDTARALARVSIGAAEIQSLTSELIASSAHNAITFHLTGLLIQALRSEARPMDPSPALDHLIELFEGLLEADQYREAAKLTARLRQLAAASRNPAEVDFAHALLSRFGAEHVVSRLLAALDSADLSSTMVEIIDYLRTVDVYAGPAILEQTDRLENAVAREMVCGLVFDITARDPESLCRRISTVRWEVAMQLLSRSTELEPPERERFLAQTLAHRYPRVRSEALRQLQSASRGWSDQRIARSIRDPDATVRMTALRVAAARACPEAVGEITSLLKDEDIEKKDARELRLLVRTYALLAGSRAIPDLERLLFSGGVFARKKKALKAAAAAGLAVIGTYESRAVLVSGARAWNMTVRNACREALASEGKE